MMIPKPYTLQSKFLSGLAAASLVLGLLFAIGFYAHMRSVLEEEVRDKAGLIFSQVDAVQQYVRNILRPKMYDTLGDDNFVIQAMSSSYISRAVMDKMQGKGNGGHIYRRVAISARNPEYEANTMELSLVEHFQKHPTETLWKGYKIVDGTEYYVMARPVRFVESCMRCHGDEEDAPPELIELYGERGFDHDLDSIGGVDVVGLSVTDSVGRLRKTIFGYFVFFMLGAILFFSTTNLLFKVLVVNNVKRLSSVFRDSLEETGGTELLAKMAERDEIEELEAGMRDLNAHLYEARAQLKNYAGNLRNMVDERTEELTREARERRADVDLFVRLLADMRSSRTRADLWEQTLPRICKRFGASQVGYVCTFASQNFFAWPVIDQRPELPEDWVKLLTESETRIAEDHAYIPVESSAGNAEGLLCLFWEQGNTLAPKDRDLLQALGRQLGTVAENLSALDNLVRQMDTLESIVEGISDPLILMDSSCTLITQNHAARSLAAELTNNRVQDGNILKPLLGYDHGDVCPMAAVIARGKPHVEEIALEGRSFALSLYPLKGGYGGAGAERIVVYTRETTMEKRILGRMQQSERMATVGKLAAGLAHEINNPLGVILCYAELMKQSLQEKQSLQDLDVILRHTRQAQRVLKDLLNFARPKVSATDSVDAGMVVERISEVFHVQAVNKGAKIFCRIEPDSCLVAIGEHELEQVLSNLVINALAAVYEGRGEIVLTVKAGEAEVEISVADNGSGIADDALSHVFDPFFTTKDPGVGTGLGLAIVYGLVSEAGGTIEVLHSETLGGAEFIVHLPVAAENVEENSAEKKTE